MPLEEATLTLQVTVTLKPEGLETENAGITAEQKEAAIKQLILDQMTTITPSYDWGIAIAGTLESSLTETVDIEESKPDYVEPTV